MDRVTRMDYRPFLADIHRQTQPRAYLEIGVRNGNSLAIARCPSVGIDPAYAVTAELKAPVALHRTSSDEYFTRPDPLADTGGVPFDLSFIDGLHLFEFAFRDFMNAERYSSPNGIIVFDDVLPRTVEEAARVRDTREWTGDVYPMIEVLARYRPDLSVLPVGTQPTGLLLVVGLDPTNTVLADHYDEIIAEFRRPDPQPVPEGVMDRLTALPPERVLAAGFLELLADHSAADSDLARRVKDNIAAELGVGFVTVS